MHAPRELGKRERQRLVASLVARKRIGTQFELIAALEGEGCRVTQATVSRDIRELGLQKVHDTLGRPRYVVPERARRPNPEAALAAVLGQFGRRSIAAGNIVVLQCELGSAPAIARALDAVEHPRVVGTLAGDDTCLIVAENATKARTLARELAELVAAA
jgi:transcriptional regulator of arginine metabolism